MRTCVCRLCKHTLSTRSGWELPRSDEWKLCCNGCPPFSKGVNRFLLFRRVELQVNITNYALDQKKKFPYHKYFYFKSMAASILKEQEGDLKWEFWKKSSKKKILCVWSIRTFRKEKTLSRLEDFSKAKLLLKDHNKNKEKLRLKNNKKEYLTILNIWKTML